MGKLIDLTGLVFDRLTVISRATNNKWNKARWHCQCECGKTTTVTSDKLQSARTKSCGCIRIKHRMTSTPTYKSWESMRRRCMNSRAHNYYLYGGRGIAVCSRWLNSFENFYEDMGERPVGKSLDRIDNNGNYEPQNCKWSTPEEQQNNTRHNNNITYNGQTMSLSRWARFTGIERSKLWHRINNGWSVERALTP